MKSDTELTPRSLNAASVLVVEDHSFVLDLLERMLAGKVGGLHGARSAEDALYNLEKTPGLAHVAIVDIHLPGMDGIKLIERIRGAESEVLKTLPVIVLTGENNMNLYRRAARLGISAFLMKPVAATALIEALESALAGRTVPIPRLDVDPVPQEAADQAPSSVDTENAPVDSSRPEPKPQEPPPAYRPINIKA
jgi:CheY-like chemotaxis protein